MNPTRTKTKAMLLRNLDCPHYLECLDLASKLHWSNFACVGCCHEHSTEGRLDIVDCLPEHDGTDWSIPQRFMEAVE